MPACPAGSIKRIVCHWTAGASFPSAEDLEAYHILVNRVGHVHRGEHAITDNLSTADGDYAAHTRGLNTGSIGLSLCGMAGANEKPFAPGPFPLTRVQWNAAIIAAADLCRRYSIKPDERGLLMHCEVEDVYGRVQRGKWDVSVRSWPAGEEWEDMTPGAELRIRVGRLLQT
jgi:hypothetical protein